MPRNRLKQLFTALVCFVGSSCTPISKAPATGGAHQPGKERWAAYYDKEMPASAFAEYDLVVFDRLYHPDLAALTGGTVTLAYISVGEVHGDTDEHALLERQKALLSPRTHWNSYAVDVTSATWRQIILEQAENALDQGFDGIMLDTVDSGLHQADMISPEKGIRAQEAMIKMIADLRKRWPHMKIMMNRGFEILPRVAPKLDYALAESTLANTDISTGQSSIFPPQTYKNLTAPLVQARMLAPALKLYTLDYWNQDDVQGIQKLYAIHRAHGFHPYITTPDLRRYTPEPEEYSPHHAVAGVSQHVEDRDA